MGPLFVVFPAPACDQHLRFRECGEDLPVEALVTQFAVEGLDIAVLPGTARLDEERGDADVGSQDRTAWAVNSGPLSERR